jgi:hypothetical protein
MLLRRVEVPGTRMNRNGKIIMVSPPVLDKHWWNAFVGKPHARIYTPGERVSVLDKMIANEHGYNLWELGGYGQDLRGKPIHHRGITHFHGKW